MSWVTTTFTTVQYGYINQPGWNSGARTIASLSADGGYRFLVGQSTGIVCGFNAVDESASYLEIDHGFFIEDTRFRVIEQGVTKTSWAAYTKDQVFKIVRLLGVVQYYLDDTLIYTSVTASEGKVFLDCSLYNYHDAIIDVEIIDYSIDQGGLEKIEVALLPLIAQGTTEDDTQYAFVDLLPLTASGTVTDVNTIEVEISSLVALGVEDNLNFVEIELLPLTVIAEEESLIPDYNAITIELRPLQVYGLQYDPDPASIDIELLPLIALGDAEGTLHRIQGSLSFLEVELYLGIQNYLSAQWPLFTVAITQLPEVLGIKNNEIIWRSVHYQRHVTEYHSPFVYETHTDSWSSEGQVVHNVHYASYESASLLNSYQTHSVSYESSTEVVSAINFALHATSYQSTVEILSDVKYSSHSVTYQSPFFVLQTQSHETSYQSTTELLNIVDVSFNEVIYQSTAELVSEIGYQSNEVIYQSTTELVSEIGYQTHEVVYQSPSLVLYTQSNEVIYQSMTEAMSEIVYQAHEVVYQSSSGSLAVQMQSVSYASSTTVSIIADSRIHVVSWESVSNIWNAQEITWKSIVADYQSHKTSWSLQPTNYKEHSTRYGSINTTPTTASGLVYVRV